MYPLYAAATVYYGSVAIAGTLVRRDSDIHDRCALRWARFTARLCGLRLTCRMAPAFDPNRSYVIVSNHLSTIDIPAVFISSPVPIRFFAKKNLFKVPIFGWALSITGHVPVDRRKGRTDFSRLDRVCEQLKRRRRSVMVFAEGTRTRNGRLQPFKMGAFHLAKHLNVPVVPVTLKGTAAINPPKRYALYPGDAEIVWHHPIEPEGLDAHQLARLARNVIARELGEPEEPEEQFVEPKVAAG